MSEDLIKIKNSVKSNTDSNELKIETGKEFRRTSSPDLDLHNFDFTKNLKLSHLIGSISINTQALSFITQKFSKLLNILKANSL